MPGNNHKRRVDLAGPASLSLALANTLGPDVRAVVEAKERKVRR